jgi:hypothetical protein
MTHSLHGIRRGRNGADMRTAPTAGRRWRCRMSLIEQSLFGVTDKVKTAIDRLRAFEPKML